MPERRQATSTTSTNGRATSVRRNLFHQHLSRRPTTSSTSTSAETLRLDIDSGTNHSEIVIRDQNGEFQIGDPPMQTFDDPEDGSNGDAQEDESRVVERILEQDILIARQGQRLADAVKHHQRDRNRAPSEPAELLEAVKASLRAKVAALAEDNWIYEAEDEAPAR